MQGAARADTIGDVQPALEPLLEPVPDLLRAHLERWVGAWPPTRPVTVVGNPRRAEPGWDGRITPLVGIVTPDGAAVVGLAPDVARRARAGLDLDLDGVLAALPDLLGTPGWAFRGVFRWTTHPVPGPDEGRWIPAEDPRVPPWLRPFRGDVLVRLDEDGSYLAGVGIKRHDPFGHELAVGTHERARGRGLARRLVAQAARRVLADGAVPTYLHDPANVASARVATAAGFADRGWQVIGFVPGAPH